MICESYHNVEFLQFHVDWIIVFDKEHLHLILQYIRSETSKSTNIQQELMN